MDELAELKREIAQLREDAQRADADIAFLLGVLMEEVFAGAEIHQAADPVAGLKTTGQPGWNAALIERITAGRASQHAARGDRYRRARRELK